jgi:hypothetical protein
VLEAANQKRFKELLKKRIIYITSVVWWALQQTRSHNIFIIIFNFFSPVEWASLRMCLLFFPSLSGAGSMIGVVTSGPGHFQSHRHTGAQCYTEKTFYFLVCNIYLCVFSTRSSIDPDCLFHHCQSCLCWEKRYISTPLITCSRVNNARCCPQSWYKPVATLNPFPCPSFLSECFCLSGNRKTGIGFHWILHRGNCSFTEWRIQSEIQLWTGKESLPQ